MDPIEIRDQRQRPLRDLRISVTDRCNFRCIYCMPKEVFGSDFAFMPRSALLSFEEIVDIATVFAQFGVQKIRLTGGEPLLRKNIEDLIKKLSAISGIQDIALTTNGSLLTKEKALRLKDAGLTRITISLDSLDEAIFQRMNDVRFPVSKVLSAIESAHEAGLSPVKINVVLKKGLNDQGILSLAERFRNTPHVLRFIEYMDVGTANGWRMDDVVPAQRIIDQIDAKWPLIALDPHHPGEVARRYQYQDGSGEIGVITSVTQPFCQGCSRARLSAEGILYTCLFGNEGYDLRNIVRNDKDHLQETVQTLWGMRNDHYSEIRTENTRLKKVEMFHIGG